MKEIIKVLLINLNYKYGFFSNYINPSLGYLAESLEENNIEHNVFDLNLYPYRKLVQKINSYNSDILCFSMMSLNYKNHYVLFSKPRIERLFYRMPLLRRIRYLLNSRKKQQGKKMKFKRVYENVIKDKVKELLW